MKEVWVFIEVQEGRVHHVSFELLGIAKKLAKDLEGKVCGVLLGWKVRLHLKEVFSYGAEKVYLLENEVLSYYRHQPYVKAFTYLAKKYQPEIILIGATPLGRDLAGGVATRVETGLTADVTELAIDLETKNLLMTRPAYGGNIMATIVCPHHRPQMATVRPRVFSTPEKGDPVIGEVVEETLEFKEEEIGVERIGFIPKEKGVNLEYAEVIVAGGKGLGGKEGFKILREIARLLGGEVGATRLAVEAGWISYEHQVGQTGKTVRPKVYLAFGISGAIQHRAGMQNSDIIIAVNLDEEAPIFKIADLGIVGDWREVATHLLEELKTRKANG